MASYASVSKGQYLTALANYLQNHDMMFCGCWLSHFIVLHNNLPSLIFAYQSLITSAHPEWGLHLYCSGDMCSWVLRPLHQGLVPALCFPHIDL